MEKRKRHAGFEAWHCYYVYTVSNFNGLVRLWFEEAFELADTTDTALVIFINSHVLYHVQIYRHIYIYSGINKPPSAAVHAGHISSGEISLIGLGSDLVSRL